MLAALWPGILQFKSPDSLTHSGEYEAVIFSAFSLPWTVWNTSLTAQQKLLLYWSRRAGGVGESISPQPAINRSVMTSPCLTQDTKSTFYCRFWGEVAEARAAPRSGSEAEQHKGLRLLRRSWDRGAAAWRGTRQRVCNVAPTPLPSLLRCWPFKKSQLCAVCCKSESVSTACVALL